MNTMSRVLSRSAGAAAALAAGLAQAHEGHGPASFVHPHGHGLEDVFASLVSLVAPFAGEAAILSLAIGAVVIWRRTRRARRASR